MIHCKEGNQAMKVGDYEVIDKSGYTNSIR
jgi:hypothetical protein